MELRHGFYKIRFATNLFVLLGVLDREGVSCLEQIEDNFAP
jgi:hypothetical protein